MRGEWNALKQDQEEVIALKARLTSLNAPCRQANTTTKRRIIFENSKIEGIKSCLISRGNSHVIKNGATLNHFHMSQNQDS
jgi:hypothetical protein